MWHSIEKLRKHVTLYKKLKETCVTLTWGNMWHFIENLKKHVALYRKLNETCGTL